MYYWCETIIIKIKIGESNRCEPNCLNKHLSTVQN